MKGGIFIHANTVTKTPDTQIFIPVFKRDDGQKPFLKFTLSVMKDGVNSNTVALIAIIALVTIVRNFSVLTRIAIRTTWLAIPQHFLQMS